MRSKPDGIVNTEIHPARIDPVRTWFGQLRSYQILRFGLAGLTSTVFYFVAAGVLVAAGNLQPVQASVLAYLLSLGVSCGLQSRFTFRQSNVSPIQISRFVVTALMGLAISYGLVFLTTEVLHWWYMVGTIAVCILIPGANYFALKLWVFPSADQEIPEDINGSKDE